MDVHADIENDDWEETTGLTFEEFAELNEIIDIAKTTNIDEISELYKTSNSNSNESGIVDPTEQDYLLNEKFSSRDELLSNIRKVAIMHGYATTIKKSKRDRYVIIGCDRSGNYRGTSVPIDQRKRATASRLINCPFEIWGKKKKHGFWEVEIKSITHNHGPSSDMSGHPSCRRFSDEEMLRIKEMALSGIPSRQILSLLRQSNPNLQAVLRTIYNAKAKIIKEILLGRTMLEALFEEFSQGNFSFDIKRDDNGHLTHLFFAHPSSIALTTNYSNVFLMDCTYKTNKYKMPLLNIVGVSSFNSSFCSCFAFMQKEEEGDYIWALEKFQKILGNGRHPSVVVTDRELALMNAIEVVFPSAGHLLCIWHIEKNILSKCKVHFEIKEDWDTFLLSWTNLIESPDELSFEEAWHLFQVQYKDRNLALSYIKDTWLPFKERFVKAWTEKYTHFGSRVTSRVEGAHAMIKKYLNVSTGNFRDVKEKICLSIDNQYKEITTKLASEKLRFPHNFRDPFFRELVRNVSVFALKALYKQYELAKSDSLLGSCRGQFSTTMGLPCAHMIKNKKDGFLQLNEIHPQWRIDKVSFTNTKGGLVFQEYQIEGLLSEFHNKYQQMPLTQKEDSRKEIARLVDSQIPLLMEPNIQPHKGRPTGSKKRKGISSTTRDPSEFEIVEKGRKCSVCQAVGHNSRTCPRK